MNRVRLSYGEIENAMRPLLPRDVDAIVAIGRGGQPPGEMAAAILGKPLGSIHLNSRDEDNVVVHDPILQSDPVIPPGRKMLLIDDVSVSGATLSTGRELLSDRQVTTLVLMGEADLVAFPELTDCPIWPWNADEKNDLGG